MKAWTHALHEKLTIRTDVLSCTSVNEPLNLVWHNHVYFGHHSRGDVLITLITLVYHISLNILVLFLLCLAIRLLVAHLATIEAFSVELLLWYASFMTKFVFVILWALGALTIPYNIGLSHPWWELFHHSCGCPLAQSWVVGSTAPNSFSDFLLFILQTIFEVFPSRW